jgi:Transposase DNA-binding/Transposase Tn5 dimerisation domain
MKRGGKNWEQEEFGEIEFGDPRLKKRFFHIADQLSQQPMAPINQAHEDWADTKAAYRFFQNERVRSEDILRPHRLRTCERIQAHPVILVVQDTTLFNYNSHSKTQGLGAIMKCGSSSSQGLVMHSAVAFTPTGVPLGILSQEIWARDKSRSLRKNKKLQKAYPRLPTKEKESYKWIRALQDTMELNSNSNRTQIITVADREADFLEFIFEAQQMNTDVLVRVCRDRKLEAERERLWSFMQKLPLAGKYVVEVPERKEQTKREATVEIRYSSVSLDPPATSVVKEAVKVNIVYIQEVDPPAKTDPLEWMLLTTSSVKSLKEAKERAAWYGVRWGIESYHRVLKSGCRVEDCKLQSADRLKRYLTLMTIIAWRIFWMTHLNRSEPNAACTTVLAEHEWKSLYCKIHKTSSLPKKIPSLRESIRWIARLGGFLARKGDGEPGPTTLWRGWHRLNDIAETWNLIHPLKTCG